MLARIGIGLTLAALAACGSNSDDVALENVSLQEAAGKAQAAIKLQPGQWQTTATIGELSMPGAPPEVQAAIGKSVARTNTVADCVTPEEAANPSAQMLTGGQGGQCRYENFSMNGGRMNAVMICSQPGQPGEMRATLTGSYAPTQYTMDMAMKMALPGIATGATGEQGMSMTARIAGKRLGECAAGAS